MSAVFFAYIGTRTNIRLLTPDHDAENCRRSYARDPDEAIKLYSHSGEHKEPGVRFERMKLERVS